MCGPAGLLLAVVNPGLTLAQTAAEKPERAAKNTPADPAPKKHTDTTKKAKSAEPRRKTRSGEERFRGAEDKKAEANAAPKNTQEKDDADRAAENADTLRSGSTPSTDPTAPANTDDGFDDFGDYDEAAAAAMAGAAGSQNDTAAATSGTASNHVDSNTPADPSLSEPHDLGSISIVATRETTTSLRRPAQVVDEAELEKFEYDDVHAVLLKVPGVYVRGEDGYGLRPNIGLRGASSNRSSKIVLMEDGVLLGPAPYSAPAAYYFPQVTRMTTVEVYKGPSAVRFGPNTIGGAINMRTRDIPDEARGGLDIAGGQNLYGKAHVHYGLSSEHFGYLIEGLRLRTNGFKELDGGGDTGFRKNDFLFKARVNSDLDRSVYHELELKLGYATEVSNETYLGLSDDDFADNAQRRYAASRLDVMAWDRSQVELTYHVSVGDELEVNTTAYRHGFSRSWKRLNRAGNSSLFDVLQDPTTAQNAVYYDILTGAQDSTAAAETLYLIDNQRDYISQGIQTEAVWRTESTSWSNELVAGARYHTDEIQRNHVEDGYFMQNGAMTATGQPSQTATRNEASAHAISLHLTDQVNFSNITLNPGVRLEIVNTKMRDELAGTTVSNDNAVVLPGLGALYAFDFGLSVLGGAHVGYSPVAPGQSNDVDPEQSLNLEGGARFKSGELELESISFYNIYSNLVGQCTFSSGCTNAQSDVQFEGGEAHITGLENALAFRAKLSEQYALPVKVAYTLTQTQFQTSFDSGNPQWGSVQSGDELPYVPKHQGSVQVSVEHELWAFHTAHSFASAMRESAGQDGDADALLTDSYYLVDVSGHYVPFDSARIYLKVGNVFDTAYIASRRPFGARPGRPRLAQLGFKYTF